MEPVTPLTLQGQHVRLEPLMPGHLDGLQAVVEGPRNTFGLTPVPRNRAELEAYVDAALEDQRAPRRFRSPPSTRAPAGWSAPPASATSSSGPSPRAPPSRQRPTGVPYAVEIGWTWLAPDAQRTAINTEAKRLMLAHAFERWEVYRVTLKTDARNVRSRTAIERIGCRLDGVLRAHSPAADGGPRDAALYSMLAREWPDARARLDARLARGGGPAT